MLYNKPVSALAIGAYFLRNDGFVLLGEPTAQDVVAGFRVRFDYPAEADDEFAKLYSDEIPDVMFDWFAPVNAPPMEPTDA